MAFELEENKGNLFSNKNKKTDKHPDFTGVCRVKVDGMTEAVKLNISGWKRKSKDTGKSYVNLKFDLYGSYKRNANNTNTTNSTPKPEFDDVPF